ALIGVGNLGTAFLRYNFSKNNNTKIIKAFDSNQDLVGTEIGGVAIEHVDQLEESLTGIEVVILTVPGEVAQPIADSLVKAGVRGILNFTPARINVPTDVRVHHIDLSVELQSLIYFTDHYPTV